MERAGQGEESIERINPPPKGMWLPWLVIIVSGARVVDALSELWTTGHVEAWKLIGYVVVMLAVGWGYYEAYKEDRASERFLHWLIENGGRVRREGAVYEGVRMTPETRVHQYEFCLSALVVRLRSVSRFEVEHGGRALRTRVVYSLFTVVFGWWAFLGSFWTLTTLSTNLRGTRRGTVDDLLHQLAWRRGGPVLLPRPRPESPEPRTLWSTVRTPLAAVGIIAVPMLLWAFALWVVRDDAVVVDNSLDIPVRWEVTSERDQDFRNTVVPFGRVILMRRAK